MKECRTDQGRAASGLRLTDCEGHLADAVGDKNDLIRCSRIDEIEQVLRRKGPW
jgi:hypothetical protein